MSAAELLQALRARGVALAADGGWLRADGPEDVLTDAGLAQLAAHKAEILVELELEAAAAELAPIERRLDELEARMSALWGVGDRGAAERVRADCRALVEGGWLQARRREARALDRLGRLPEADRYLLEDDEPPSAFEPDPERGGWRETAEAAARCVFGDAPLAANDAIYCAGCRARADGSPEQAEVARSE